LNTSKINAAKISVFSNTFLVISKIAIAVSIGSVSILSEGIHSSMDLFASLLAYYAVKMAAKPADDKHNYGHGKFENVSGTIEALLIFIAAVFIITESVTKFFNPHTVTHIELGIAIMAISSIINFFISNHLLKVSKETDSIALYADAMHLRSDIYTSLGVMFGLIAVYFTGIQLLDPLVAIGVAFILIHTSWGMIKDAFSPLVDSSLPKEDEDKIIAHIEFHSDKYIEYKQLRTRKSGSRQHIDFYLTFCHSMSIADAHSFTDIIEDEIRLSFPNADILIHLEPCYSHHKCNDSTDS